MKTWDFLPEFMRALDAQLKDDFSRYGDTWLELPRKNQELRMMKTISGYFNDYLRERKPVPWLKIAGNALIAWAREQRPDIWKE